MRTRRNTSRCGRRVRAHQLDRLGIDGREPAQRVHEHREEAQDRRDRDLRPRAEDPEPRVRDRCERDDRDRVRRDHVRHQRVAERAPAREDERRRGSRAPLPRTNPPTASLNVIHAAAEEQVALVDESAGRRRRTSAAGSPRLRARRGEATARPRGRGRRRRRPAASRAAARRGVGEASASMPTVLTRSPPPWRGAPRPRRRRWRAATPEPAVTSSKNRGSSRVSPSAAAAGRSGRRDVIRPGRGDMTTTRVDRNTASEIEWVTKITVEPVSAQMRSSSRLRRSRVISSSAPNGSSMSRSAGENESARAIETRCCMPPESCQGWCFSNPVSSTSSSISLTRAARFARSQPSISSGKRDVLRDRAPVVEDGRLEHDPVVAVEPRPAGRLPVHGDVARRRLDDVARRCAAAWTFRNPTVRSARRTRRARPPGRCPGAPSHRPCRRPSRGP